MFISIPYNKGFKAYVNGKETPIYSANIAYMGISLNEGYNKVEFKYETPYLKSGFKISLLALGVLLAYSFIDLTVFIYKKKKILQNKF